MSDGHDDKLSADIRRLMGEDTPPKPAAPPLDEPLLLTDPLDDPSPTEPSTPVASNQIDHSITGALAKLDAREASQSAGLTVSDRPLDAIVQEALQPLLTEWLDKNLDRIVREQVDAALRAEGSRAE